MTGALYTANKGPSVQFQWGDASQAFWKPMGTLCLRGDWGPGGAVGAPEGQAEIPKVLNVQANPLWRVMAPSCISLLMSCCVQIDENPVHDYQNLPSTSV